jgi:hypothetical protein
MSKTPKASQLPDGAPKRDFRTVRSALGRAGGYDPTLPDRSKPRQLLREWLDGDKTRVAVQSFAASCEATWPNGSRIAHWLRPRYATALLVRCNICYRRLVWQGPTIGRVSVAVVAAAESIRFTSCACAGKLRLTEESIQRTENMRPRHSFPQPLEAYTSTGRAV